MPRPPKLELTEELIDQAPPELRAEYARSFRASGTGPRLASAGLRVSADPVAIPADALGASAAFRVSGERGLVADVYYFDRSDTLAEASRRLEALPAPEGGSCGSAQNGAFLVRVSATGETAQLGVGDVLSAIAGEE